MAGVDERRRIAQTKPKAKATIMPRAVRLDGHQRRFQQRRQYFPGELPVERQRTPP